MVSILRGVRQKVNYWYLGVVGRYHLGSFLLKMFKYKAITGHLVILGQTRLSHSVCIKCLKTQIQNKCRDSTPLRIT